MTARFQELIQMEQLMLLGMSIAFNNNELNGSIVPLERRISIHEEF
jgi:hypothetical protein